MAKRSTKKKAAPQKQAPAELAQKIPPSQASTWWLPLLLAAIAFTLYAPSLWSEFVYDDRAEILEEGFITNISNLWAVLSLKVLGMKLILGPRPGTMLYLMLIATVSGTNPFGYHLCSNLLHAANVALLFVLAIRLAKMEWPGLTAVSLRRVQLAAAVAVLLFAAHPVAVEAVAAVNYCSDLLVAFFTLLALLAATAFRPGQARDNVLLVAGATLCAFAAVTCKESGIAAALLPIVYWFLFRRREPIRPWLLFLAAPIAATLAFLSLRFANVPHALDQPDYLGGTFLAVLWPQSKFWVFMLGKLVWPLGLSAGYGLEDVINFPLPLALAILFAVLALQTWLATKSRIGALGIAMFWIGLATVSNFVPLYCLVADRYYYLPLAGLALQLLALTGFLLKSSDGFWAILIPCLVLLFPLTILTITRQNVFATEYSLWSETAAVNPLNSVAHMNLANALQRMNRLDEAQTQFGLALQIQPKYAEAAYDLGNLLLQKGQLDDAIACYEKSVQAKPSFLLAHHNLGTAYAQRGDADNAIVQFQQALDLNPDYAPAQDGLGQALLDKGRLDEAILHAKRAVELTPTSISFMNNLAVALAKAGRLDEAIVIYRQALQLDASYYQIHNNLGDALLNQGHTADAIAEFQQALRLNPNFTLAQTNLAKAQAQLQHPAAPKK